MLRPGLRYFVVPLPEHNSQPTVLHSPSCLVSGCFIVPRLAQRIPPNPPNSVPSPTYPGGATEFTLSDNDRVVAEYVAVRDLTITNRDADKTVNIEMFLQITRG